MNEERPINAEKGGHNLKIMVALSLILSFVLLGFGLWLYQSSGTYLLDLSRPGYQPEVETTDTKDDWSFSPSGELKAEDVESFNFHLDQKLNKLKDANAFSEEALSDESLGF
jgi:hypothetical protein